MSSMGYNFTCTSVNCVSKRNVVQAVSPPSPPGRFEIYRSAIACAISIATKPFATQPQPYFRRSPTQPQTQ
eukprot:2326854-Alexandrium_andersonii.AAC.1